MKTTWNNQNGLKFLVWIYDDRMNSFNFSCDDGDLDHDWIATSLEYLDDLEKNGGTPSQMLKMNVRKSHPLV